MSLVPGTVLGRYRLVSPLGKGGMGEVWAAEDDRLKRQVALKVLPPELAADAAALSRFQREAESLAALSHPNIVTVFSVEEADGFHFLTMERIDGETLEELIRDGGLDRESFFGWAVDLADAVASAHGRGLIHRDLKPANVMVTGQGSIRPGLLKVLDFGLAKKAAVDAVATQAETLQNITRPGAVLGTAPYMSPEQVRGETLDARSDVFSLASVLYEMATGRRAFDGADMSEILVAVLSRQPASVATLRPDLADLEPILEACWRKDVGERTRTASEILDDLRATASAPPPAPAKIDDTLAPSSHRPKSPPAAARPQRTTTAGSTSGRESRLSLAVLPFRALGSDTDSVAVADALSSDLIDGLARASFLRVLPSGISDRHRDAGDLQQAGEELDVSYVLSGRVRTSGRRLRISAQLLSVVTGDPFWTDDYDADLEVVDLFDFQDQVRDKIAATVGDVHGSIVDFERSLLEGLPLEELDPWQCICVTLGYDKFVDAEHHRVALAACERAAELAPEMPIAWGYLSWLYTDVWLIGWEADLDDPLQRAMEVARRSVELAPRGYMEAWLLSRVHFFRGELEAFREEGERSVRLAPQSATTVGLVGLYTMLSGNWERGRELIERARSINPVAPRYLHWPQAVDAYRRGEDEEALREQHRTGNEMNWIMQSLLPAILMRLGRESEAQAAWRKIESLNPDVDEAAVAEGLEKMNVRGALLESILVTLRPVMASV